MNNRDWKKRCLRILDSGKVGKEDWELAAAMIDEGWATGVPMKDFSADGGVKHLIYNGTTLLGRIQSDSLRRQIWEASFTYKALRALRYLASFVVGVASGVLIRYADSLATQLSTLPID